MRAVVFEEAGRVRLAQVADPVLLEPDDAVVRVSRAAICGSDLHFFHLKTPIDPGEVLGHEAVGVVETVGPAVARFRPGDRVVMAFVIACGRCWFCERGESGLCEDYRNLGAGIFGGGLPGAQAELVRVPVADVNLLAVPADMEDERALFVGDILTTGFFAASQASIGPDDVVAVVGAGPVGFFAAQAARTLGAGLVLVLDRELNRLELAERAGAVPIHVRERHPVSAVAAETGGRGADVVIEAVGTAAAFQTAVEAARRGGRIVVAGVFAGETIEVQLGVYWARGITIRFTGICPIHAWWDRAMLEVAAGRIDPLPLISHRLPLDEAPFGYELFDRREASKVVLLP